MAKLFGTDGVRGVANKELTPELAFNLGRAGAYVLADKQNKQNAIVIGRDTRISGDMLEAALIAGICSVGVDVYKVGVIPTPAIAFLTRELGALAGVVISASHNPVEDNGIKFFGPSGYKLPDQTEEQIEKMVLDGATYPVPVAGDLGRVYTIEDAVDKYVQFACNTIEADLTGLKIVVDCANGAAYQVAPQIYSRLGAEVIPIFNTPDGVNINDHCGSTHPEALMKSVVEHRAHIGLAHDGDADRVLAVDANGNLVDGDQIMVICAKHLKEKGLLKNDTLVVTVMSNLGLHTALKESGIKVLETQVGDRYVMEKMLASGAILGGEQSGHIIFLDHNSTGDGIVTGLQLLAVMQETKQPLAQLAAQMERYPQLLRNVRVTDKQAVMSSPQLAAAIAEGEQQLAGTGRILVRPSGTEPIMRVMAEAKDQQQLVAVVEKIVAMVEKLS